MYRILASAAVLLFLAFAPPVRQEQVRGGTIFVSYMAGDRVENGPFTARYEIKRTWTVAGSVSQTDEESGSLFRDSQGRLCEEPDGGADGWIQDPVIDILFEGPGTAGPPGVRPLSTALQASFRDEDQKGIWFSMPYPELPAKGTAIGRKTIDGVECEGFLVVRPDDVPGGYTSEYWVSTQIHRIVLEKITAANTEQVYRLYDVQYGEPPASKFLIPIRQEQSFTGLAPRSLKC